MRQQTLDLRQRPPVSYTMPLPTQAMFFVAPWGRWLRMASAGGCVAALPTPYTPATTAEKSRPGVSSWIVMSHQPHTSGWITVKIFPCQLQTPVTKSQVNSWLTVLDMLQSTADSTHILHSATDTTHKIFKHSVPEVSLRKLMSHQPHTSGWISLSKFFHTSSKHQSPNHK